jgi:hypothetical protein
LVNNSTLALAPVFVFLCAVVTGATAGTFADPPEYTKPNTSVLHYLVTRGRLLPTDFRGRLNDFCAPPSRPELGSACIPFIYPPAIHFDEFRTVLETWQGQLPTLLTFHPQNTILSIYFQKPHRLPLSFSLADGYSAALFKYIVQRSRPLMTNEFREGELVVVTKDLSALDELQWNLLKELTGIWKLEQVHATENFAIYRMVKGPHSTDETILSLPNRPVKTRNGFPE